MLLSREYNRNVVEGAIVKASKIDRLKALEKVEKVKKDRPVLAITFYPMLLSITSIATKHWKTMATDSLALKLFPQQPMVAYRQPPNLKQTLCRAKLPGGKRSQRHQIGMKRCTHSCTACIHMMDTKIIKSRNGETYPMTEQFKCQTKSVIYLATCEKCKKQYVGQTGRKLHERIMEHLRYIRKGINALGEHYKNNSCDSGRHLKFQIIEQVFPNTDTMRLHREKLWIDKLQVKEPNGLNRQA